MFMNFILNLMLQVLCVMCYSLHSCLGSLVLIGGTVSHHNASGAGPTHAYGDGSFSCNYCDKKVPPLPRIKFNVEINNATRFIPATIFAEKAEELYNITAAEMINNTTNDNPSVEMIHKLSAPNNSAIMLRASMYTYGPIIQCVFGVYSYLQLNFRLASSRASIKPGSRTKHPPKACNKITLHSRITSKQGHNMKEDGAVEPLKNKQKKE